MQSLVICLAALAASDAKDLEWVAEPTPATALPATSGKRLSEAELAALTEGQPRVPFKQLTVGVRMADGTLWVGSPHGLMQLPPQGQRWRLFHSRRWLPADDVQDLSISAEGAVVVKTSAGFGKLLAQKRSLEEKMASINDMLQKHHLRNGLVTHISLREPGNLATASVQPTNDNDGLWTSLYVAAEAFRYGATGDPTAKRNARRSLEALMFLERITGISGFVARSVVPIDDDPRKYDGEWHRSADNLWWWKGDTSSDELVGHYFAYQVYHDVAANDQEKQEISQYVARITDHILDHGLYYVGPPGKPTTWGVWAPEKLNHDLRRFGDRGLNSLEILSHLKVAEHMTGKPRYTEMLRELIEKHAYATNAVGQKQVWPPQAVNHSDDELAFLSYYPLLLLERDSELRTKYLVSIKRSWLIERPEHSPLFNLIYGAALQASTWTDPSHRPDQAHVAPADYDHDECMAWFRDVPQDTIHWTVINSKRQDITLLGNNRFRRPASQDALPVSERHVMRWNGDPYVLDGGSDGRERDDGAPILLPYWMGRYHRLID